MSRTTSTIHGSITCRAAAPVERGADDPAVDGTTQDGFGAQAKVCATFGYTVTDPWAVTVGIAATLGGRPAGRQRWTLSRELLAEALLRAGQRVGLGDVAIERRTGAAQLDGGSDDQLRIELSAPSGYAELLLPAPLVERFLTATLDLVPAGAEADRIVWAAELAGLTFTEQEGTQS